MYKDIFFSSLDKQIRLYFVIVVYWQYPATILKTGSPMQKHPMLSS